ncbi:thioredoxin-like protein [Dysgonomonas alginatilytica]|uniref:Thioredoxin-like protein n=1 Tax=Dysgonomonas alginatilytica TaxID=1605892 RepID=A0A2V3PK36_9BACT|nr:thioredoxin family protein [Dysgonomonas alginatilytica]PXV58865.1 thioredoxin-like protein [Dysgonomonas alginatilytica]
MMLKNRIGEQATDFSYTLASGKTGTLHQVKSDYSLLLFYNPDCHACEETIAGIKASPILSQLIQSKTLTILSFYPDADIAIWKKHLIDIPKDWINGYDKELAVQNKRLYDLKAIPSLYLLDKNKNVLLKDTELTLIEEYLKTKNK